MTRDELVGRAWCGFLRIGLPNCIKSRPTTSGCNTSRRWLAPRLHVYAYPL